MGVAGGPATGASGEPLGLIPGAATYGITVTAVGATASWAAFRAAVTRFMAGNAASGSGDVSLLIRPELWAVLDGALITGTAVSEYDRLIAQIGKVMMTTNALDAPTGTPPASNAVLTTSAGGVAPAFVGLWGAVDMIRDPYADAASGGLRLTALATMDLTVARGVQTEILTGLQ